MSSEFEPVVTQKPNDRIFDLMISYQLDSFPDKIDLAPGIYKTDQGLPWVLPSVKEATSRLVNAPDYNHEYLPIGGLPAFVDATARFIMGPKLAASGRVATVQTLSGTGACHMIALWLKHYWDFPTETKDIYISDPTWFNHYDCFRHAGLRPVNYPYWDPIHLSLDMDRLMQTIENAPPRSVFCLHAVGHNPTGVDPTLEQWLQLGQAFKRKGHFAFFDSAYLGLVSGRVEQDRKAIDLFFNNLNVKGAVGVAYGKNAGLYGERIGSLHVLCEDVSEAKAVEAQLCDYSRWENSGLPRFPAELIAMLINTPDLNLMWQADIQTMSKRMTTVRHWLYDELIKAATPGDWSHILTQQGMFSYTGLTSAQCTYLVNEKHCYLPDSGRIAMCGITSTNVSRVAALFKEAITLHP